MPAAHQFALASFRASVHALRLRAAPAPSIVDSNLGSSLGTSAERWESDRNGLIAVSTTPDGPRVETTDHGTGESTVVLVSGDTQVRGMTVPRRGDEVYRAAAQVIAAATA